MSSPKTHNISNWIVFATIFCVLSIGSIEPACAQSQPEPPGMIMPTLIPTDALRVNIAYVTKQLGPSARCKIYIRSLLDGEILVEEDIRLEPGKGMSKDYSFRELQGTRGYNESQLDAAGDLPLRVQIKATSRKHIFVGVEIHDDMLTETRTYIPVGAAPLY